MTACSSNGWKSRKPSAGASSSPIAPKKSRNTPRWWRWAAASCSRTGIARLPDVKAGDKILFGKYSGSDIRIDGDEYLILREDEILGVFANE